MVICFYFLLMVYVLQLFVCDYRMSWKHQNALFIFKSLIKGV